MVSEVDKLRISAAYQAAVERSKVAGELASLWVRSLLLVNGGAIAGLTALAKGGAFDASPCLLAIALGAFAASAVLTLIALMVAYCGEVDGQNSAAKVADDLARAASADQPLPDVEAVAMASWLVAIILAGLSLLALLVGLGASIVIVTAQ